MTYALRRFSGARAGLARFSHQGLDPPSGVASDRTYRDPVGSLEKRAVAKPPLPEFLSGNDKDWMFRANRLWIQAGHLDGLSFSSLPCIKGGFAF